MITPQLGFIGEKNMKFMLGNECHSLSPSTNNNFILIFVMCGS